LANHRVDAKYSSGFLAFGIPILVWLITSRKLHRKGCASGMPGMPQETRTAMDSPIVDLPCTLLHASHGVKNGQTHPQLTTFGRDSKGIPRNL